MRASVTVADYEHGFRPAERGCLVEAAHHAAIDWLQLAPGHRVLDLGCGTGPLLQLLARNKALAIGLDYSAGSLGVARTTADRALLVRSAAPTLPFTNACFDRIAALGVLGYLSREDLGRTIGECARVLRPSGIMLICTGRRLNAVASHALRWRSGTQRAAARTHSHLHARSVYRRALRDAGFAIADWVAWPNAPRRWWAPLLRPFFASRWIAATRRASP